MINIVAALENLVAEPSYRPGTKIPWYLSLIGAIGSLFVMYLISPTALVIAFLLEGGFYIYFKKRALEQEWGDVNVGMWMKIARFSLLRMNRYHVKRRNWRPMILLFAKDIPDRIELVKLAAAFGQNRGIFSISKLIFESDKFDRADRKRIQEKMIQDVHDIGLEAFCEVNVVESINKGILNISRAHGIAGFKTNTIMFGWAEDNTANVNQLRIIRSLSGMGKNILIAKFNDHENWKVKKHRHIDVWWSGAANNGDLMMILAYMLTLNPEWKNANIRVREVIENAEQQESYSESIRHSLKEARIDAFVEVITKNGRSFPQILQEFSSNADLVLLGLKHTEAGEEENHAEKIDQLSKVGKVSVFVQNNSLDETFPILLSSANVQEGL